MKQCRYCKSQIDETASKCPICREWQSSWSAGGPGRRIISMMIVGIIFYFGLVHYVFRSVSEMQFKPAASSFKLAYVRKNVTSTSIEIVGEELVLENLDSTLMSDVEVTFYDKKNKLVDMSKVYLGSVYKKGDLVPFKVHFGGCSASQEKTFENYDHFKIRMAGQEQSKEGL